MKVGIVGLGLMGMSFARSLIAKDYEVYGYDINPAQGKALNEAGGHACGSCAELGSNVESVIMMVFSAENVHSVLYGQESLLSTLPAGSAILITCSVGDEVVREIAPDLKKRGMRLLDTPLMGNCDDAAAGTINIMIAADNADYESQKSLLSDMGGALYLISEEPGRGQIAKSCVQALFSLTFETAFEVVSLAKKAGLDMEQMHRLFQNGPSSSELFHFTEQCVLERSFTGMKNPLSILHKDINIVTELADRYNMDLKACKGTADIFAEAFAEYPKEDIFAAVKVVEEKKS